MNQKELFEKKFREEFERQRKGAQKLKAEQEVKNNLYNKGYRDGYAKGLSVLKDIRSEIENFKEWNTEEKAMKYAILSIIDRYINREEQENTDGSNS